MAADVTIARMEARPCARLFFALWPDAAARAALAAWQPVLQGLCGGRAMPAEDLHLTLLFLGEVGLHRLEALSLAAQEVRGEPFELSLDAAHYWGHNHLVYAAPHLVPLRLAQLVQDLQRSLRKHRFSFDKRTYKPHLTLLRHAKWNDAPKAGNPLPTEGWTELTPPLPRAGSVAWQAREFVLAQSDTGKDGTRYRVLASFPLR